MNAPRRLVEDEGAPEMLRVDLRAASENVDAPFDIAMGLERFRRAAGMGGSGSPGGGSGTSGPISSAAASLGSPWRWPSVVGAVGGALAVFFLWNTQKEPESKDSRLSESLPTEVALRVEVPPPVDGSPGAKKADPKPTVSESKAAVSASKATVAASKAFGSAPKATVTASKATVPPSPPSKTMGEVAPEVSAEQRPARDADFLTREVEHLKQLRSEFAGNPTLALALAEEGHQTFRGGVLYEEREALLIMSLQEVGRTADARIRAQRFREQFPRSAFLAKLTPLAADP